MRLIDADLAKVMLMQRARLVHFGFEDRLCVPYDAVDEVPTVGDAVEVVRCRDCKHHRMFRDRDMCAKNADMLNGREVGLKSTRADDFCSRGERRTDE